MKTKSQYKISALTTVFPPMSSQEAVWLRDDPEVETRLRQSDFYMIAARAELKFVDISVDQRARTINFRVAGNGLVDDVSIHIDKHPGLKAANPDSILIECGPKFIRIWSNPDSPDEQVSAWFTADSLLRDRWRGAPFISGLAQYRKFATYDLLYVGIAKKGDSYDRLIAKGHEKRQEILSNEPQRGEGARVADEVILFLFRVEPLTVQTFEPDHEFEDSDFSENVELKRIVADAEKAFVSLLKPTYNVTLFKDFPKGRDGLYKGQYDRYGYAIAEGITLNTPSGSIKGGYDIPTGFISNEADFIFVEGDHVQLYVSGVDFPQGPA
jgi:hypothetical protein